MPKQPLSLMSFDEHIRAADHHLTMAYKLSKKQRRHATQDSDQICDILDELADFEHLIKGHIGRGDRI